ncbi:unnamed protein product [Rotaria sp. Silwood1]|nr:unnamed protein product [Rotaria sp. Silwood1]
MVLTTIECSLAEVDFVEVLDEAHHVPIIRKPRVNVFIAKVARNRTTMFHRHKENTVYVVIASSRCITQLLGSNILPQEYTAGDCFAGEYRLKPIIHRVECLDESPSDAWFVGTEILHNKQFLSGTILQHNHYSYISNINLPGCRAYRLKLIPNETTDFHLLNFSGVIVSLANTHLEINSGKIDQNFPLTSGTVEMGYVTWFDGPIWLEIKNIGSNNYEAIILELA